jgi:hypothetical protein
MKKQMVGNFGKAIASLTLVGLIIFCMVYFHSPYFLWLLLLMFCIW